MSTDPHQPYSGGQYPNSAQYPGAPQNPSTPQYPGQAAYPGQAPYQPGSGEMLGGTFLPQGKRARRKGPVAAVAGVVGMATLGAGGYFADGLVGGGGERADTMLPANAVAVITVDLDPSVSQKAGAIQFARKFPRSKDLDWDSADKDPRKWVYEQVSKGEPSAPPWSEVTRWLGKRAGMAVLPPAAGTTEPSVVVALQVSDQAKAKASLAKMTDSDTKAKVGVAGEGEWVLVSQTQAEADAALASAKGSSVSDAPVYSADMKALGGEGIANVWLDYPGLASVSDSLAARGNGMTASASSLTGMAGMKGHGATTLRFDGAALELVGSFRDLNQVTMPFAGSATVDVSAPADAIGTFSVGGLGAQMAVQWQPILDQINTLNGDSAKMTSADLEEQTGLKLPGDLTALLGDQLCLVVAGTAADPSVGLRVKSAGPDLEGALGRLTALATDQARTELTPTTIPGGYVLSFGTPVAGLTDDGTLDSAPAFTAAVPNAGQASAVGYIDIAKAVTAFAGDMSEVDRAELAPLQSFGFSANRDGDTGSSFTMRLTTK